MNIPLYWLVIIYVEPVGLYGIGVFILWKPGLVTSAEEQSNILKTCLGELDDVEWLQPAIVQKAHQPLLQWTHIYDEWESHQFLQPNVSLGI